MWFDEAVLYQIYPLGLCGAPEYNDGVTVPRIRRLLEGKRQTDLTPTLIRQITAKILLGPTGAIAVKLKNGQILGKEPPS